jgi:hypothetical protein
VYGNAVKSERDAVRFLRAAKFALRYGATPSLPLASMYEAAGDQRLAIELTNALLASGEGIETNLVGGRLVIAHRDVIPALFALRVRFRRPRLSDDAARAFELIRGGQGVSSGDVRRMLGGFRSPGALGRARAKRPDRADLALAELMTDLLIDRGPSSVPERGIPYLSKEGYPYRVFAEAHPELVAKAKRLSIPRAIALVTAPFEGVAARKLASMLKLIATKEELAG